MELLPSSSFREREGLREGPCGLVVESEGETTSREVVSLGAGSTVSLVVMSLSVVVFR